MNRCRNGLLTLVTALVPVALLLDPASALATSSCRHELPVHELEIPEMLVAQDPPATLEPFDAAVRRGRYEDPDENGDGEVSCDEAIFDEASRNCPASEDHLGWVDLRFAPPVDDRTPPHKVGYRLVLVSGTLPDGLYLPVDPVRAYERSTAMHAIQLAWDDGETNDQEPLDFTLDVIPIDLAGLEGPPTRIVVAHGGTSSSGCGTSRIPGSSLPLLLCLLMLGLLRLACSARSPASGTPGTAERQ
jgi:hypothetical protein